MARTLFHPGELLREELQARGIDRHREWAFPYEHGIDVCLFYDVLNGTGSIDALVAEKLSVAFGTSAELWVNLQRQYDESVTS